MSDDAVKLKIIFDGKEAQNHALPLGDLGKSLQGIASVIAVSGTFVLSHEIPLRPSEYKVQVYTKAEFKAGSIEIILYIKTIADYLKEFGEVAAGILALMGLLKMIFGKRDKNLDNYALADLLKEDHNIFRQTIDKLLIINQKYVEQAINPVGRSCDTVSLFQDEKMIASVDRDVKKSIQQWQPDQKSEQFVQEVVITSINKRKCKCKFYLYDDYLEDPEDISVFSAEIKDDAFNTPGSAYIDSLDEATPIKVKIVKKDTQGLKPTFEIIGLADNQ